MTRHSILRRGLALLILAGFVAGCSQLPTAPNDAPHASGARLVAPPGDEPGAPEPAPAATPGPTSVQSAEASRTMLPLVGGTVAAGKFRVLVPPGALSRRATVTVRQPDLRKQEVQLEISPPTANGFLVPVLLVADCSDMTPQLLSLQTIYWWNPGTSAWQAVPGVEVSLLGKSVTAPLWHFSTYKVGSKAGW
jgi:hypothetical protein